MRALQISFKDKVEKSGIKKQGLHFHSLRHSFAVRCMEKGIPLNQVQALLGHESIATTNIYTRINPKEALDKYLCQENPHRPHYALLLLLEDIFLIFYRE